jgi:hypothetical protein
VATIPSRNCAVRDTLASLCTSAGCLQVPLSINCRSKGVSVNHVNVRGKDACGGREPECKYHGFAGGSRWPISAATLLLTLARAKPVAAFPNRLQLHDGYHHRQTPSTRSLLALGQITTRHVGSLSSPIGPHRRRRDPQCLEQNRFGTKTARPRPADSSRELQQSICGLIVSPGRGRTPIGMLADELTL